ncbi:MAG: hypothetical protein ARM1_0240 [Candidatus Micrarchaeota archaeon]|nr:MAG: hypothetical protein ARM1_0240 [Candidatus Micrarchaeota archaeon]
MRLTKLPLILSDMGGVIIEFDNSYIAERYAELFNIDPKKANALIERYSELLDINKIKIDEFFSIIAKELNISKRRAREEWINTIKARAKVDRDIEEIYRSYKLKGYTIAYITDVSRVSYLIEKRMNLIDYSLPDRIFISSYTGYSKKDPRAFYKVLDYYAVKPKEVVFIDDRDQNIETAKKIGIRCIKYKDKDSFIKALRNELDE